ncbi:MAG: helix-turn-helix domain-containing protein [Pseudobdellovibrio sp.]
MSFAEFDSVKSQSLKIQSLLEQTQTEMFKHTDILIVAGAKGSGRKTFAQYLKKKFTHLSHFEILEVSNLQDIKKNAFNIIEDISDSHLDANAMVLHMPSLAERKEDIPALADFYIGVHALMNGKDKMILSEKAKEKLLAYNWSGQFFEFENVIEQAVRESQRLVIEPENLTLPESKEELNFSLGLKLENVERQYILQTLFFVQQNRTKAAEVLGISIRTLRNKLNQYRQEGYL